MDNLEDTLQGMMRNIMGETYDKMEQARQRLIQARKDGVTEGELNSRAMGTAVDGIDLDKFIEADTPIKMAKFLVEQFSQEWLPPQKGKA